MERFEILYQVLAGLDRAGVLQSLVLVGSWCQDFYRLRFGTPASIPAARTTDADILVPRELKLRTPIDVPKVLEDIDFVAVTDYRTGLAKYTHPRLDVEFLTTARAGPRESVHHFPELGGLTAQELRFMGIPLQYHEPFVVRDLTVNIPEPEAYALHKLLVSTRRRNEAKAVRDLNAASGLLIFFKEHPSREQRLIQIFEALAPAWQRRIFKVLKQSGLQLPQP